jgi:hypothetical protein
LTASWRTGRATYRGPRTRLREQMISRLSCAFAQLFSSSNPSVRAIPDRVRQRKQRSARRDFQWRAARRRAVNIGAVGEAQFPHDFPERRNRRQVPSSCERRRSATRLGQPHGLEAGRSPPGASSRRFARARPASQRDRRLARLCMARKLLFAVARPGLRFSLRNLRFAENFAFGALARPFGGQSWLIGMSARICWFKNALYRIFCFSAIICSNTDNQERPGRT